ncbi:HypC/HybG/HupF family hydrogenase formation chaperone [Xylanimonas ulmi]|uniref:Hydrogenase assembly chaperone HypC/HupF n=1 Tax=Xylanimonas ulmi TaxID=228973 RepID=A0A4Q7M6V8_9MICO|nr:HypC/HybG/HupF family hydrogenase formation chaperone [Xylanibacterium ulmi]RZS62823.1 hydrogenase assembly chaperone HypC/HupF [Xylanibacterium ulmi]
MLFVRIDALLGDRDASRAAGRGRPGATMSRFTVEREDVRMCLGIPGRIVRVWDDQGTRMADVDFGGATKDVCLAYLPHARAGQYTIVHAGFGLTLVDEASAVESLRVFHELGMLEDELGIPSRAGSPGRVSAAG